MPASQSIYSAEDITKKIIPVLESEKIVKAYLFGSYARKEANERSDIDLFVKSNDPDFSLLNIAGIWLKLFEALGKEIDVYNLSGLEDAEDNFKKEFERDKVLIYDADKEHQNS